MDIPNDNELDHKVRVSIDDDYAVMMLNSCLYYDSKGFRASTYGGCEVPGLTIDNLIHYGLIKVEGDEAGNKIFNDLLDIRLPK